MSDLLVTNTEPEIVSREDGQIRMEEYLDSKEKGIFDVFMRFGKTKPVINHINKLATRALENSGPVPAILWVVPSVETRDKSLPNEFIINGMEHLLPYVKIITWRSLHKIVHEYLDMVILDEVHKITTACLPFFYRNTIMKIFGLTGTYPTDNQKKYLLKQLGLKVLLKIDSEESISLGAIAPFKINIHHFKLDDTSKHITVGNKNISELQSYTNSTNSISYLQSVNRVVPKSLRFKRMRTIHNSVSRLGEVKKLVQELTLQDKRFIVFAASIKQADQISTNVYYTKSGTDSLNNFLEEKIDHIVVVEKVTEGVTFKNVDGCIVVSPDGSMIKLLQKMGRTLIPREGYEAQVHIFCAQETVQEQWLVDALVSGNINDDRIAYSTNST